MICTCKLQSTVESLIVKYREDICLQTLLLLFKCANHKNKRFFVSTANEALVGTLMTIGDVNNIFPILVSTEVVHCCADISISVEIYRKRSYITVRIYIANCEVPLTMYGVSVS